MSHDNPMSKRSESKVVLGGHVIGNISIASMCTASALTCYQIDPIGNAVS